MTILTVGNHGCRHISKLVWIKARHEVHDENKYEVTEDLYKNRRRIVPDATQRCLVSGHPCDKRDQGEWKGGELFGEKIIFSRRRGKLLPSPSHLSPISEVSRRRKKFSIDPGCSSSPYNCKQMWLLINWSKASGKFEENAEINRTSTV